jgi:hypothetical protein
MLGLIYGTWWIIGPLLVLVLGRAAWRRWRR